MEEYEIQIVRIFKAPIHKVFEALSHVEIMAQYAGNCVFEQKTGGDFQMFDGWVTGKVLVYDPNVLLCYTWHPQEWEKEENTLVSIRFESHPEGTCIRLKHSGFYDDNEAKNHEMGWEEYVFGPMEKVLSLAKS